MAAGVVLALGSAASLLIVMTRVMDVGMDAAAEGISSATGSFWGDREFNRVDDTQLATVDTGILV